MLHQMSNLDIYSISHYNDKDVFADLDELGLLMDRMDFATNGYAVDEVHHPRTVSKSCGRKNKAMV